MSTETTSSSARFVVWMALAVLVVVADQATKWAIVQWVDLYQKIPINSFINLTHQRNTGAAFSFLADAGGWQRWFFVVLATGVSIVIAVWLWRIRNERQTVLAAGRALVLGGAIGNPVDRAMQGYVPDFLQVGPGVWGFSSFHGPHPGTPSRPPLPLTDAPFSSGNNPY